MRSNRRLTFVYVTLAVTLGILIHTLLSAGDSASSGPLRLPRSPEETAVTGPDPRYRRPPARTLPRLELAAPMPEAGASEAAEQKQETRARQYDVILARTFESQTADPAWSRQAETQARDMLTPLVAPGSSLRSLACRRSLCRIEVGHEGIEGHRDLITALSHGLLWQGPGWITREQTDGGSIATVAFFGRPGEELPQMPD